MDPVTPGTTTPPKPHGHPSYVGIFVALAALTAFELGIAFLPWSKGVLVVILIALAFWKALLVALYYMHLRFETRQVMLLALAPLPFVVILFLAGLMEKFD
jgi:cytochrome c oxidase subunit IV